MACDAQPRLVVAPEDVVQHRFRSRVLGVARLALVAAPELVVFREPGLEFERREGRGDVGLVGAPVAGVYCHALAEAFLDDGDEGVLVGRDGDVAKGDVGGVAAANQGAGVVRLEIGHLLGRVAVLEVGVCLEGFVCAGWGQEGIGPAGGGVAVLFGPVALSSC